VSGLAGFGVLIRKELLETVRTFRLPIVVGLFAVVGIGSPLLARFTPEIVEALAGDMGIPVPTPTVEAAIDQLLKNLAQFGGLTAILLAMGSVAAEKERGTAALLLTKPVGRAAFLGAKVAALGLVFLLACLPSCLPWLACGAVLQRLLRSDRAFRIFNVTMAALLALSVILFLW